MTTANRQVIEIKLLIFARRDGSPYMCVEGVEKKAFYTDDSDIDCYTRAAFKEVEDAFEESGP